MYILRTGYVLIPFLKFIYMEILRNSNNTVKKILFAVMLLLGSTGIYSCKTDSKEKPNVKTDKCTACDSVLDDNGECANCNNQQCIGEGCDESCETPIEGCRKYSTGTEKVDCTGSSCPGNCKNTKTDCAAKKVDCTGSSCPGNCKNTKTDCAAKKVDCTGSACPGNCKNTKTDCAAKKVDCTGSSCLGNCKNTKTDCAAKKVDCTGSACPGNCKNTKTDCGDKDVDCKECGSTNKIKQKEKAKGGINEYCTTCKNKDATCKAPDCQKGHPRKSFGNLGYCPDCRNNSSACEAKHCKGNQPNGYRNDEGYCSDCVKVSSCNSGFCPITHPIKDHNDKWGYCPSCLNQKGPCEIDGCGGTKKLKDHVDHLGSRACQDCMDTNVECEIDGCGEGKPLKEHVDHLGIRACQDCMDTNVECEIDGCGEGKPLKEHVDHLGTRACQDCMDTDIECEIDGCGGTKKLKDHVDHLGIRACQDCMYKDIACFAKGCGGTKKLKDHVDGICSDCSSDPSKELEIDRLNFNKLKSIIATIKDSKIGGITEENFKDLDKTEWDKMKTFVLELQRLKIIKPTIKDNGKVDFRSNFVLSNYKGKITKVYCHDAGDWITTADILANIEINTSRITFDTDSYSDDDDVYIGVRDLRTNTIYSIKTSEIKE